MTIRSVSRIALPAAGNDLFWARAALLCAALIWSSGALGIRSVTVEAATLVGYRCFFAAVLLLPLVRRARWPSPGEMLVSVALSLLMVLTYVASVRSTTAANASLLQYTAPAYVILLAPWLLREPASRTDHRAAAVSMLGVAILFMGNWQSGELQGLILGLGSGLFYALFILWQRRLRSGDATAVVFANCLGVALLLLPFVGDDAPRDLSTLGWLLYMSAVMIVTPSVLFTWGLQKVRGTEASQLTLIEPVLAPIWAALALAEFPTPATILGGLCILASLALRLRKKDT